MRLNAGKFVWRTRTFNIVSEWPPRQAFLLLSSHKLNEIHIHIAAIDTFIATVPQPPYRDFRPMRGPIGADSRRSAERKS